MSQSPCLSIITACHNNLLELQRTASALYKLKGFFEAEWLIVDRDSKDGTAEWVRGLRWPNTHLIAAPRGTDFYPALNLGLGYAKGDTLWFLAAGDTMQPALLDNLPETNAPVLFFGARRQGLVTPQKFGMPYPLRAMLIAGKTGIKFPEDYTVSADYAYLLAHLKRAHLKVTDIPQIHNGQFVDLIEEDITDKNKAMRDIECFTICWKKLGFNLSLLWYAVRMSGRLFGRIRGGAGATA